MYKRDVSLKLCTNAIVWLLCRDFHTTIPTVIFVQKFNFNFPTISTSHDFKDFLLTLTLSVDLFIITND